MMYCRVLVLVLSLVICLLHNTINKLNKLILQAYMTSCNESVFNHLELKLVRYVLVDMFKPHCKCYAKSTKLHDSCICSIYQFTTYKIY